MRKRTIEDFFLKELTDYSSYSTLRMISSAIDGQKNSQRKIVYTALDKLKSSTKVSVFDNQMQSYTQYLHGNAAGVISNMGASFCGSNNLPLLKGEGNFGSRMVNEPAAPRYIYVSRPDYLDKLFDIRDVLIPQSFEGDKIEPLFFVPCVPLLLVNGSMDCLATGFKQHILPRSLDDIKKYYSGKKTELKPFVKGFKGRVVNDGENPRKWYFEGIIELKKNKAHVTEIPPFIEYSKYLEILDDLVEKKKIRGYKDLTNVKTQQYEFEVTLVKESKEREVLELLKLRKPEVEIYNCIDENNKVKTFESIEEILDYFKEIRLKYLELQRLFDIEKTKETLLINASRYKFILMIMQDELKVYKRSRQEIVKDLEKTNLYKGEDEKYSYLLSMQIHSFTNETLEILKSKVEQLQVELKNLESKSVKDEFLQKLGEFKI